MKAQVKKYKKPLIALVLLAAVLLGYFTKDKWMSIFKKNEMSNPNNGSSTTTANNAYNTTIDKNKVLKRGDKGESVKELQRLMNKQILVFDSVPLEALVVDGIFGAKTEERLNYYTQQNSISINQFSSKMTA